MVNEIIKKIINTEDCRILDDAEIQKIDSIRSYKNVIEVTTEVSFKSGIKEIVLYIGIPDPPVTLPKMYIKNESYDDIKFIPHINKDLNICIYDEGMNHVFNELFFPEIVEEMIHRAKRIIAQGGELGTILVEFEREFKAYWEISYDKIDIVSETGLSITSDAPLPYKGYHFNSPLNGFRYLIYQECEIFEGFKKYLDYRNVQYSDIEVFEIEYIEKMPPFNLSFNVSTKYIKESDLKRFKQVINRHGMHKALVIFKNLVGEHFGWIYSRTIPPLSIMKGWRVNLSSWQILTSSTFIKSFVERLTFSSLNPERLKKRTSGFFTENKITICIIGLGSVGSNLFEFLNETTHKKIPFN